MNRHTSSTILIAPHYSTASPVDVDTLPSIIEIRRDQEGQAEWAYTGDQEIVLRPGQRSVKGKRKSEACIDCHRSKQRVGQHPLVPRDLYLILDSVHTHETSRMQRFRRLVCLQLDEQS